MTATMTLGVRRSALITLVVAFVTLGWPDGTLLRPATAQVFVTPQGEAQNVRFEQREAGIVHVFYDLVSNDARALFSVVLEASQDRGSTFGMRPQNLTGDTGKGITPGAGKRIVWDSGKDVERVQIDQFRFRIVATAGRLESVPASPAGKMTGALTLGRSQQAHRW